MNKRRVKFAGLAAITVSLMTVAAYKAHQVEQEKKFSYKGRITSERLWEVPNFGHLYRIEVTADDGTMTPFVFPGSKEELVALDKQYNVGDLVRVRPDTTMYSVDGEAVIGHDWIKKKPY